MNFEEKKHISVGPWGGQDGAKWDDGVHSGIMQVVICYGAGIESIQIEYDRKGSSVWSEKHGGTGGLRTNKIKFEYPEEFLVSVSGHYGSIVEYGQVLVRSLTFESNRRKYGPFGIQQGTHFALPTNGGKVVGFHGRSSWHLDSIGVHLKPLVQNNHKSSTYVVEKNKGAGYFEEENYNNLIYVQCGGYSGDRYNDYRNFEFEMLKNAMLTPWTGDILRAPPIDPWKTISSEFSGVNSGAIFEYDVHKTGSEIQQVITNSKDTIEGSTSSPRKTETRPSGLRRWRDNSAPQLDAEAENLGDVSTPPQTKGLIGAPEGNPRNAVSSQGPWGGSGGALFNDGVFSGVRQVHITRHGGLVSIRACYDSNGQAVWGNTNGESNGIRLDKIVFDYPSEILTQISGYYGPTMSRGGPTVVKSLTFHTNKRKYGPFGEEQGGTPFSSASDKAARIVGFHGRKGRFIDSIGVHVIIEESLPPAAPSFLFRRPDDSFTLAAPPKPYEVPPVMKEIAPNPPFHDSLTKTSPKAYELSHATMTDVVPNSPSRIPNPPFRTLRGFFTKSNPKVYEVPPATVKEVAPPTKCGPWGGNGGKPWDDGVFEGVRSIYLTKGIVIYCIHIEYDKNGRSVWSPRHGSGGDRTSHMIKFDYPNEVLTGISGHYDSLTGDGTNFVIKSLTFVTNKGKHGPYGEESGTSFSGKAQGKIVGFHGRSACFLNNIGVYVQP